MIVCLAFPFSTAEKVAVPVRPKRAATPAYCIPAPLMHSVSKGQSLTVAHLLFKATSCVSGKKSMPINVHREHYISRWSQSLSSTENSSSANFLKFHATTEASHEWSSVCSSVFYQWTKHFLPNRILKPMELCNNLYCSIHPLSTCTPVHLCFHAII